ncbi:hypothetical protein Kpol_1018p192 [Vanderwaltozyma polyspora DSM 70294]|uniref:Uncharacterized protein n=1 Tax=Vanderwaltozyma polyspora (strain ATCC 22028 / DSM 70294 / BCRC 21397 / CBS 2163 / NBRC 10782 / NRRL Y-8283 / UCD 57-17) TaxID=436907 RepID=A7TE32_VANPO|nr:uncharacterized protein Kpol_1018p192 [Vanderwaltozyma polyspora DSM 70294]EDO19652.1 hypothetical protein Kpol_1018p192 [Vanderwaltozyma polyspora DSM 70294]
MKAIKSCPTLLVLLFVSLLRYVTAVAIYETTVYLTLEWPDETTSTKKPATTKALPSPKKTIRGKNKIQKRAGVEENGNGAFVMYTDMPDSAADRADRAADARATILTESTYSIEINTITKSDGTLDVETTYHVYSRAPFTSTRTSKVLGSADSTTTLETIITTYVGTNKGVTTETIYVVGTPRHALTSVSYTHWTGTYESTINTIISTITDQDNEETTQTLYIVETPQSTTTTTPIEITTTSTTPVEITTTSTTPVEITTTSTTPVEITTTSTTPVEITTTSTTPVEITTTSTTPNPTTTTTSSVPITTSSSSDITSMSTIQSAQSSFF